MDNEENMNAAPAPEAVPAEEEKRECCCENAACTGTPAAEPAEAAPAPAEESCDCACKDAPCCEDAPAPAAESAPAEDAQEKPEKAEKPERPVIPVTQDMLEDVRSKLAMMLDYLGLEATVKAEAGNSKINLTVASEDAGRIIGRKGQNLESLQLLLNRMMQKNDVNYPKIYIDIDGYSSGTKRAPADRADRADRAERAERPERGERRDRHERGDRRDHRGGDRGERHERRERRSEGGFDSHDENLRMLALDAAKEVRMWGDPKTLPEMNAHDRRIIHVTLENEADLSTDSVGEEPHKSVVIQLKK